MALEKLIFIVIICSWDLWGHVWDDVYLKRRVDTYVYSIEHALERERSDSCSREKVRRSISLRRISTVGWVEGFLAQTKGRAYWTVEENGISICKIPRPGCLCTNTGLFIFLDGISSCYCCYGIDSQLSSRHSIPFVLFECLKPSIILNSIPTLGSLEVLVEE